MTLINGSIEKKITRKGRHLVPGMAAMVGAAALAVPVVLAPAAAAVASPAAAAAAESQQSQPQPRAQSQSRWGGSVMVSGKRWLGGKGVDVLRGRQCVELATRLYSRNHWGSLNNIYGLSPGRTYDRYVKFHRNGSGYVPVPGDVLVELGGSYQHVAVVDRVTSRAIYTVEQNAVPSGRHVYRWKGKKASGAYGVRYVGGFIHSSRNHFGSPKKPAKHPAKKATVTA